MSILKGKNAIEEIKKEVPVSNRRNWRVYNVPVELISKYISFAKLYYNNEVWKVMEYAMELLEKEQTGVQNVAERIETLEKRVKVLESRLEEDDNIETFGGTYSGKFKDK